MVSTRVCSTDWHRTPTSVGVQLLATIPTPPSYDASPSEQLRSIRKSVGEVEAPAIESSIPRPSAFTEFDAVGAEGMKAALLDAFKGVISIANFVASENQKPRHLFVKYFDIKDFALVETVFIRMSGKAVDAFGDAYFKDSLTFRKIPYGTPATTPPRIMALLSRHDRMAAEADPSAYVEVWPTWYALPTLAQVTCDVVKRKPYTSAYMHSREEVLLHEFIHWAKVTTNFDVEARIGQIPDWINQKPDYAVPGVPETPEDGYGPYGPLYIRAAGGDAAANADSYVWYALELYYAKKCGLPVYTKPDGTEYGYFAPTPDASENGPFRYYQQVEVHDY